MAVQIIVNVSQCFEGNVNPACKEGLELAKAGVVAGGRKTLDCAYAKLCSVLGRRRHAPTEMGTCLRGEM